METEFPLQVILPLGIALMIFGVGLELRWHGFIQLARTPNVSLIAVICQFLLLPSLAFLLAMAFDLSPELRIGLVLLAASPGASTAVFYTYLGGGNIALAMALNAFGKLLAVFTLPLYTALALQLFAGGGMIPNMPVAELMGRLVVLVLFPAMVGMAVGYRFPRFARHARIWVKRAGLLMIVVLVVWVVMREWVNLPEMLAQVGLPTLALCLAAMTMAAAIVHLMSLEVANRTAIVLITTMQSGGLAILVATGVLETPAMAVPAAIYSLIMYPLAGLFAAGMRIQAS